MFDCRNWDDANICRVAVERVNRDHHGRPEFIQQNEVHFAPVGIPSLWGIYEHNR